MKKVFLLAVIMLFAGNFFANYVHAEVKNFEGSGSYPITDEKTHGEVKELAKKEAVRDALEKAGVAIFSQTTVKNQMVTKDVIKMTVGSILKILDDKYKFIPVDEDDGIGMYNAVVLIVVDTDELDKKLQDFLKKELDEQSTLASQYEELQKLYSETTKRIAELEKQLANKNSSQDIQKIKNEVAEIDEDTLYAQKIDEGWQAYDNKNFEQSLKIFDEAIKLNPNDYQGYYGRGTSYLDLKNYMQAIQDFNKSIELNPYHRLSYNNRGISYKNLKNYSQAIEDYNQATKLNPNAYVTYNNLGNIYRILKNYDKATENLNKCVQINPNYSLAYYNRGLVHYELKNYKKAVEDFTKYIQLVPDDYDGYQMRGKCYQALGNNEQAEKDFAKARELGWNS